MGSEEYNNGNRMDGIGVTKGVAVVTVWTGTGFGARWKTEKRAAILVAAMAMMARLKPLVGAIGDSSQACNS